MKFSIISPTLNSCSFIEQTIESVLQQKYESILEYFVFDGGSEDDTLNVLKAYNTKIDKIQISRDNGQADAINKGIKLAKGEVINWLNSDDYYEPNALQVVNRYFDENTNVVAGRSRIFDNNGTKYYSIGTDIYPGNLPKTIGWARIDQPETFFHKSAWDKVGLLNEDLHYVFDREWWIRYLFHFGLKGFKKIPDVLVNFRHHGDSKTVSRKKNFVLESRQVYAAYARRIGEKRIEDALLKSENVTGNAHFEIPKAALRDLILSMLHYHLLQLGNEYYAQNENEKAKIFLDLVNKRYLAIEDQSLLTRLKFRNQFPNPITKLARKIKGVL